MALVLTEEQEGIRRTARELVQERLPVAQLRALRDRRDPIGYSPEAWRELARLGFAGMVFPDEYGGAGLGFAELGIVLEECGRTLAATPFLSTVALGGSALLLGGSEALRRAHLPAVCAGERILAFAHEEGSRHARYGVATRAERAAGGFRLDGEKTMVFDGHVADAFVVVARTSGASGDRDGLGLFLVRADAPGVSVTRTFLVDSRNAARVGFAGVLADEASVLGVVDRGAELLDAVLDRGTVALAAEMFGGLEEAFDRTVAYLKTRKQFGVPIGSFQALKHRAALMFCEVELSCSIVREALAAVDARREDAPALASVAKARVSDAFLLIANEAIQMHGGIGVTDELDIGFFLKRARVAEMAFGDAAYHRDRYARLSGY